MTAVISFWIVGSFVLAPIVGRAMRARPAPKTSSVGARVAA